MDESLFGTFQLVLPISMRTTARSKENGNDLDLSDHEKALSAPLRLRKASADDQEPKTNYSHCPLQSLQNDAPIEAIHCYPSWTCPRLFVPTASFLGTMIGNNMHCLRFRGTSQHPSSIILFYR
eukprot:791738_1